MIPNIIHFIFGLKKQDEEFLFVYYLSVYSAQKINNPDKIYFYYHYEPFGKWWEKLKEIKSVEFVKVNLPESIGSKKIIKTAHRADKLRMELLYTKGGVYMDIDTISIRPYKNLLNNKTVMCQEYHVKDNRKSGLCNAIMLTEPKSTFFKNWIGRYEQYFNPEGWQESSILLPKALAKIFKEDITILSPEYFFKPNFNETEDIFINFKQIQKEAITLHLWETHSKKYFNQIKDWDWCYKNSHTIYGKAMLNLIDKKDLTDVTFIIPLKIDSKKRENNLKRSVRYLQKNFNTNIIIYECDYNSNEEKIRSWFNNPITYVFEKIEDSNFWRTRILNNMTKMSKTDIIVNYDVDVIINHISLISSKYYIKENLSDIVYPYNGQFYDVKKDQFSLIENNRIEEINLDKCEKMHNNSVGGCFLFSRERYKKVGLENENFKVWGFEDNERFIRSKKLGLRVNRSSGVLLHMNHERTKKSGNFYLAEKVNDNKDLYDKIYDMSTEELKEYVKTFNWIK